MVCERDLNVIIMVSIGWICSIYTVIEFNNRMPVVC